MLAGTGSALALRLAAAILVAQLLGPGARGQFAAVATAVEVLHRVLGHGLPEAVAYKTSRGALTVEDVRRTARRLIRLVPVSLGLGLAATTLPGFAGGGTAGAIAIVVTLASIPLVTARQSLHRDHLFASGHVLAPAGCEVTRGAIPLFAAIVIAATSGGSDRQWLLVGSILVGELASLAIAAAASARLVAPTDRPAVDVATLDGEVRAYARQALPSAVLQPVNQRADQLVLAAFVTSAQLGVYSAAVSLSLLVGTAGVAFSQTLYPKLRAMGRSGDGVNEVVRRIITHIILVSSPLAVVLVIWPQPILTTVFGPEFAAAATATRLLAVGALLTGVGLALLHATNARGRPQLGSRAQVLALLVQVILLPVLVHFYGITGAAVASLAAYSARLVVLGVGPSVRRRTSTHGLAT